MTKQAATALLEQNFSVIPVHPANHPTKPKAPFGKWKQYQKEAMLLGQVEHLFNDNEDIAVVCGAVSIGLKCIDFDKPELFPIYMEALQKIDSELAESLVVHKTPSGGYHLFYRCLSAVEGNQKLATSADSKKVYIETRGEGGYALIPPSHGYKAVKHSLLSIPVIKPEQDQTITNLAKSYSEKQEQPEYSKNQTGNGLKPGDDFNQQKTNEIPSMLESNGWACVGSGSGGNDYWRRPGKDRGVSATYNNGCFWVWTTSTNIPTGPHDAFGLYAYFKHNGDFSAAAKDLVAQGYGDKPEAKTEIHQAIDKLCDLDSIERELERKRISKEFGIRTKAIDEYLATKTEDTEQGASNEEIVTDVEPWEKPVNGAELLDTLVANLKKYVVLVPGAAEATALWVVFTYCYDAFRIMPRLGFVSPEKRCGKTTLLETVSAFVNKALLASNISPAAIYRVIEKCRPTLLIDEADTFLKANDESRGVLNSGHTRISAFVVRVDPETLEPAKFSTWAPIIIAMIGRLPDTLHDRSIIIMMRRKLKGEHRAKLDIDFQENSLDTRRKCKKWAVDNFDTLRAIRAEVPPTGNDRADDNWQPLFTIATVAGGEWLEKVKIAHAQLMNIVPEDDSIGMKLLGDIQAIFQWKKSDRIFSEELINLLISNKEAPWGEWKHGKPITQKVLSELLKDFGVKSKKLRIGASTKRGYHLDTLQDAFDRYLTPPPTPSQSGTPEQVNNINRLDQKQSGTQGKHVPLQKGLNLLKPLDCSNVPLQNPYLGGSCNKKTKNEIYQEGTI
ncbi:DUF3631 domain-containing protein [Desulfogranum marinum]|uniref:DUF3631 domain-containing protein n=1 Tax=Desulfogranum marinum TaxID=453220 RepID=UPI0029C89604|nr:DUF3631 domain-containing protein [Desulfogranum marinum]